MQVVATTTQSGEGDKEMRPPSMVAPRGAVGDKDTCNQDRKGWCVKRPVGADRRKCR